jgi:hypothetical protein
MADHPETCPSTWCGLRCSLAPHRDGLHGSGIPPVEWSTTQAIANGDTSLPVPPGSPVDVPPVREQVRAALCARGLSGAALGRELGLYGTGAQTVVSHYLAGRREFDLHRLAAVSRILDVVLVIAPTEPEE